MVTKNRRMRAWRPGFGTKRRLAGVPVPLAARVLWCFDDGGQMEERRRGRNWMDLV